MDAKKEHIKKIEELAKEVLLLKQELGLRRPLLIEFCGAPKAGKTTTITSLNIFLKRNGFKTVVLSEKASICPIDKKTHPFFNVWTFTRSVADILEHLSRGKDQVDVILVDRGIFDALCWFDWLIENPIQNPHLDYDNYESIKPFATMKMFTAYLDLVYVFTATAKTSLEREYANLLTEKFGSIMRPDVLDSYARVVELARDKYKNIFQRIEKIDTTDIEPDQVSFQVTSSILNILKDILIEKIGYFDLAIKQQLRKGINSIEVIEPLTLEFGNRDKVEESENIQPIPIAVITNEARDKVLVVKKNYKKAGKGSPEKNKHLIYIGGHIRKEDSREKSQDIFKETLHREINEEIGESIFIKNTAPFLIYTPNNPKSTRHLAVCYVIVLDLDDKKFTPSTTEFVSKTSTGKSGQIVEIKTLQKERLINEDWSKEILKHVFGIKEEEVDIEPSLPFDGDFK